MYFAIVKTRMGVGRFSSASSQLTTVQMLGNAALLTISKYWKLWSDPWLLVLVLHNIAFEQVRGFFSFVKGDPDRLGMTRQSIKQMTATFLNPDR